MDPNVFPRTLFLAQASRVGEGFRRTHAAIQARDSGQVEYKSRRTANSRNELERTTG